MGQKYCQRSITINQDEHEIRLNPDLTVFYDGYKFTVDQTRQLGNDKSFKLSQLGNKILFVSYKYQFWVIYKESGISIGASHKLVNTIDGLCGFYNKKKSDDKRMPDGILATNTTQFIHSWANSDDTLICDVKQCPVEIQNTAWETCKQLKEKSLGQCSTVMDISRYMSRCLESVCACLGKGETESKCRCDMLQEFVLECKKWDSSIDLPTWRIDHNCRKCINIFCSHYLGSWIISR